MALFSSLSQGNSLWKGMCAAPNGDIYVALYEGSIYKRSGGIGNFITLSQTARRWMGMAYNPLTGNVYADAQQLSGMGIGDIYMQTGGIGNFNSTGNTSYVWNGDMCSDPSGNVYAINNGGSGYIYKQTAGVGSFSSLGGTARNYTGLCASPNGNIYAAVYGGDIYISTDGGANFSALSQTSRNWNAMCASPNGDIFACVGSGDIYRRKGGVGDFIALSQTSRSWKAMCASPNREIYADVYGGDIYLYAPPYSVVYNGNGNTSGSVPVDSYHYEDYDTATVLGNTGTLERDWFEFIGWNTSADGTGTHYDSDDVFIVGAASVTLYAEWKPILYANFEGTPTSGDVPLQVSFTDLTYWITTPFVEREWNFGDGTIEKTASSTIVHTYRRPGSYTVSLKVTVENYNEDIDYGESPEQTTDTETKVDYIVVAQPDTKELVSMCLRMATETGEGVGWSEFENDDFVKPIENGVNLISDESDVERCIIDDEDGNIYEYATFDKITTLKPNFTDKADIDGDSGTEISGERWGKEVTAGIGEKNKRVYDEKSWLQVHPSDAETRGKAGYDSSGMRDEQTFGLDVYQDGETLIRSAVVNDMPENGELSFVGNRIESKRIQYVFKFGASEFKLTEEKHNVLIKDATGSTEEKTMTEYTKQFYFENEKILHITRGNFLYDRVSKRFASGNAVSCEGPDEYDESAIQAVGEIVLPNSEVTAAYFDILLFAGSGTGHPVLTFKNSSGVTLFTLNEYTPICEKIISGWNIFRGSYSGTLPAWVVITADSYPFKMYDLRIFAKSSYESGWGTTKLEAIHQYYRDVATNHGNAFLPSFISL